jgi:hypothetical protein
MMPRAETDGFPDHERRISIERFRFYQIMAESFRVGSHDLFTHLLHKFPDRNEIKSPFLPAMAGIVFSF